MVPSTVCRDAWPSAFGAASIRASPKSTNLYLAGRSNHHVARFQIAVNDAVLCRLRQRVSDLRGIFQRFANAQPFTRDHFRERFAVDIFHHEVVRPDIVERCDIRMIQSGNRSRLAFAESSR